MQHSPRVFISYSHDTVEHQEKVLHLADKLRSDGIDAEIDQYNFTPVEGWPLWCQRNIADADFVLMICTQTYCRRVSGDEERNKGLGAVWEAHIIRQLIYDCGASSSRFVPVILSGASFDFVPHPMRGWTHYLADNEEGYESLYRFLTGQLSCPRPPLGPIRSLNTRSRKWQLAAMHVASASTIQLPTDLPASMSSNFDKVSTYLSPFESKTLAYKSQKRFLCGKIVADSWLQTEFMENPYRTMPDPTDTEVTSEDLKMHYFFWIPSKEYLSGKILQLFTPIVAICSPDPLGVVERIEGLLSDRELKILEMPPGKTKNDDKEKIFTAIGLSLVRELVVMVTIPKIILCTGRNNPSIACDSILDLFLVPLLEMHKSFCINEFNIYLPQHARVFNKGQGRNEIICKCKKISKAVYPSGKYSVGFSDNVPSWRLFERLARFAAWALGYYHNSDDNRWILLLESAIVNNHSAGSSDLEEPV